MRTSRASCDDDDDDSLYGIPSPLLPCGQDWMLGLVVIPAMLGSLQIPGLLSVMSQAVPSSEQGVLQGSIVSLRMLGRVRRRRSTCLSMSYYFTCNYEEQDIPSAPIFRAYSEEMCIR